MSIYIWAYAEYNVELIQMLAVLQKMDASSSSCCNNSFRQGPKWYYWLWFGMKLRPVYTTSLQELVYVICWRVEVGISIITHEICASHFRLVHNTLHYLGRRKYCTCILWKCHIFIANKILNTIKIETFLVRYQEQHINIITQT